MNSSKPRTPRNYLRVGPRIHSLQDISLNYEGHNEEVVVRPPDVSRKGMFINTSRKFPEGAVLNLRFRLALTGAEIQTRCEVRYCLTDVGVGVEFVGISPKAVTQIEREIARCVRKPQRDRKPQRNRSPRTPRKRPPRRLAR